MVPTAGEHLAWTSAEAQQTLGFSAEEPATDDKGFGEITATSAVSVTTVPMTVGRISFGLNSMVG